MLINYEECIYLFRWSPHTHLDQFEREPFMEDAVDPRSAWELVGLDLVTRALDTLLKIHRELLHHPGEIREEDALNVYRWRTVFLKYLNISSLGPWPPQVLTFRKEPL